MGIVVVAGLAARAAGVPFVAMTWTLSRTSSAALEEDLAVDLPGACPEKLDRFEVEDFASRRLSNSRRRSLYASSR